MSRHSGIAQRLRQMIAVLEEERQALADMDIDALAQAHETKWALCEDFGAPGDVVTDSECRALASTAKRLNEINRTIRNLLAANIEARLNAVTGKPQVYAVTRAQ